MKGFDPHCPYYGRVAANGSSIPGRRLGLVRMDPTRAPSSAGLAFCDLIINWTLSSLLATQPPYNAAADHVSRLPHCAQSNS